LISRGVIDFKFIVVKAFPGFLKSITFKTLSFVKRQYFKFYSDAVWIFSPVIFQQNVRKSDLIFFSNLPDFKGDYLKSQNLRDYFDSEPKTLFVPNFTDSTLLS